jgi:hypothetical protein
VTTEIKSFFQLYILIEQESSLKKNLFSILLYPFHSDSILGLDVCHRQKTIFFSITERIPNIQKGVNQRGGGYKKIFRSLLIYLYGLQV